MIQKISEVIREQIISSYYELDEQAAAIAVLDKIEELGMAPPFNEIAYYKTWRDGGRGLDWDKEVKEDE